MKSISCDVVDITPLTGVVYQIRLKPSVPLAFKAGQYLLVHMGEDDKRPFSIASAEYETDFIELHIGAVPSNKYAYEVLHKMKTEGKVEVSGGFGEAYYRPSSNPSMLVAGGTGFSYAYSILNQALHQDKDADITLYWGSRNIEDFYLLDKLQKLSKEHRYFNFIPVVEHPNADWKGRVGWVHQAVLSDYPTLSDRQVYIAGRFEMAKTARDDFFARGLAKEALYGDAYAFL